MWILSHIHTDTKCIQCTPHKLHYLFLEELGGTRVIRIDIDYGLHTKKVRYRCGPKHLLVKRSGGVVNLQNPGGQPVWVDSDGFDQYKGHSLEKVRRTVLEEMNRKYCCLPNIVCSCICACGKDEKHNCWTIGTALKNRLATAGRA